MIACPGCGAPMSEPAPEGCPEADRHTVSTVHERPENLVERAADDAMAAAWKRLEAEGAVGPETIVMVMIDRAKTGEGEQNAVSAASKHDEPATVVEVLAMLLMMAHSTAKLAGKELKIASLGNTDPRDN